MESNSPLTKGKSARSKPKRIRNEVVQYVVRKLLLVKRYLLLWYTITRTTLRSMYLPDEVHVYSDVFIRVVFAMYILPFLVIVITLTHAALQRVVWVLVVPVTQSMERNPYPASNLRTLLGGLWDVWFKIIPFITLGLSVATVGHKTLNCLMEALIDATLRHQNQDYPLMKSRLVFVTKTKVRLTFFLIVFVSLFILLELALYTDLIVTWSSTGPSLLTYAMWVIIFVEVGFVFFTVVHGAPQNVVDLASSFTRRARRHPRARNEGKEKGPNEEVLSEPSKPSSEKATPVANRRPVDALNESLGSPGSPGSVGSLASPGSPGSSSTGDHRRLTEDEEGSLDGYQFFVYIEDNWWEKNVHQMRYIGFVLAVVFACLFGFLRGALFGFTSFVLMLMYLNVPHLFGYTALSVTFGALGCFRPCKWLHRHRDAISPFLVLLTPYQLILLYSFYYFRHHPLTCLIMVPVNALLIARTIDLIREFDVTVHGCVRWYDDDNNIIPPSLSIMLEYAYEQKHEHVDIVSLDMSIDLKKKQIYYSNEKKVVQLRRVQVIPYGNAKHFIYSKEFYAYTIPKLLSMQSPGYLSGSRFRTARVMLRGVTFTFLVVFGIIVGGMVIQAAFPVTRPLPVRVSVPEDYSALALNHIVVHLDLLSKQYKNASSEDPSSAPSRWRTTNQWDDMVSGDLYPHLCTREYHNTTVFELSLLSAASYLFDKDEILTLLHFMNLHLGSDWTLRERHGTHCKQGDSGHTPTRWIGFYDFYSATRDLSVISIRGTDLSSFTDFLIDVNMFFETVLYQVVTSVIPGASVIPPELVSDLIRLVSLPPTDSVYDLSTNYYRNTSNHTNATAEAKRYKNDPRRETWADLTQSHNESLRYCRQNNYQRDFYADAYNHIVYIGSRKVHPAHIVITGHSLGGSVAAILAGQLEVPAVLFSAPGIVMARKRFNVNLRALHKHVMTVFTSNDIVPLIGSHGGEVQHMECLAQTKELCHAMEFIIGSLWRSCESIRDRFPSIERVF